MKYKRTLFYGATHTICHPHHHKTTETHILWKKISQNCRELAVTMGGVLTKLGHFLSVRVDILPREVTTELSGLRDEIPAEPIDAIDCSNRRGLWGTGK